MKNTLLAIFLCLLACIAQAQDTIHYFNKTFNPAPDTTNLLINAALAVEDGYIAAGNYTSLNDRAVFIAKFNWQGDTIWFKILDTSYNVGNFIWGQQLIRTSDGNCVLQYTKLLNMSKDIWLSKFDINGNILWKHAYGDWANEDPYQVIETHDGGFAMFGANQYPNDTTSYFLMKIDANNEFEWQTTYMLDDSSVGLSIQQTADHGYILGGYGYSNITGYDTYIVKTDSAGIVQWETNFGGDYDDCGGNVTLLANNQYLISTCDHASNNSIDTHMRFSKLNSAGQIIWDTIYYTIPELVYPDCPIIFLSDSSFVTVLNFRSEITGKRSNWFTHFDLQGNILSRHEYTSNPNESVYLKDLRRTPDGGFIMAGYEYTSTPQKGYLVKTDSLGRSCSWVECDSVAYSFPDAVPPPPNIANNWQVYPNPAQDYLVVQHHSLEKDVTFVLYDVVGKTVLQQTLNSPSFGGGEGEAFGGGKGEATISTKQLPSGIYLYQIINPQKQTLQYGKVSIVR